MASVLLVHPLFLSKNPTEQELSSPYFPLGILYLASFVRESGHTVTIFDGTFEDDESAFAERLRTDEPDIVGISALATTKAMALTLARMAHDAGAVVLAGGPDPTLTPAAYLADESVDLVVHHEGEQTMVALLDLFEAGRLDLDVVAAEPGIAYRADGRVTINEPRPPLEDLDELPLPARDLIDMERYLDSWTEASGYSSVTIATSRGCPYGCDWCRASVHGTGFRQRSPESVAAEVAHLNERYEIDRLRVVDDVEGIERGWFDRWAAAATEQDAVVPFEPLNAITVDDIPMLDVQDSL